ncbi:MAG: FAD:protein FMN transferase [Neisseria sp.]|nr:FAD:protein FMN transferase [Neisseria sp.]
MKPINRRTLLGAAALLGLATPWLLRQTVNGGEETLPEPFVWQGIALGSGAELRLYHADRQTAAQAVKAALAEVERLEKLFSLYRDDSLIVRLNREGRLKNPPADFLTLLSLSSEIHRLSEGAFDPTIQPLWQFYSSWFQKNPQQPPPERALAEAAAKVGLQHVFFDENEIRFAKHGMALSFNGIAQGYITDRICALLQSRGIDTALADLGEIRAIGNHTWQAGIRKPKTDEILLNVPLRNQALATSGGYGTVLDESGRYTHLFDPASGKSTPLYQSISVMANSAARADALSTALAVSPPERLRRIVQKTGGLQVWMVGNNGEIEHLQS